MVSILDIAKEARVSHGTVSNVLNGKGNVSSKRIALVEEAARKLGYKINYTAKSLRSGTTNSLSIILPSLEMEEYVQFYKGVVREAEHRGFKTNLFFTYDDPRKEKEILSSAAEERPSGVIAFSCLDDATYYYDALNLPKEDIIFCNRSLEHASEVVMFDFEKAGSDLAAYVNDKNYKRIGIFTGDEHFSNEKLFKESLTQHIKGEFVHIESATLSQEYAQAFQFILEEPLDVVITTNMQKAIAVKKAFNYGTLQSMPQIICLSSLQTTYHSSIISYYQDYGYLGSKITKKLIQSIHVEEKSYSEVYENDGIYRGQISYKKKTGSIKILTISTPTTKALQKIIPHFEKNTNIKVELEITNYKDIFKILSEKKEWSKYDLIRMDLVGLPWYGKSVYLPLDQLNKDLDKIIEALPKELKNHYSFVNEMPFAIPFDISTQMLFYRKDLFENEIIKRKFYETKKKQLKVPDTFAEYNEIVEFFTSSDLSTIESMYGASMVTGSPEIVAADFLTRYYGLKGSLINKDSVELDEEKAKLALTSYIESIHFSKTFDSLWWGDEVNSFINGESAMVLGFMNHVSVLSQSNIKSSIGTANVPDGTPLLGGGIIGITKESKNIEQAIQFLLWVNDNEIAEQITMLGGNTSKHLLSSNSTIQNLYPWLLKAKYTFMNGIRENSFENGQGMNLRETEEIIGAEIMKVIHKEGQDIRKTVKKINHLFKERQRELIVSN